MATQKVSNKRRRLDPSVRKNRMFRLSVVGIALTCLCAGVGVFKVFKVSPEKVSPGVRVSGVDCIQAWLEKRQARIHEEAGRHSLALLAWKSCNANHPYHEQNLRSALRAYVHMEHPTQQHVRDVVHYGQQFAAMGMEESMDCLIAPLVLVWMGAVSEAAELVLSMEPPPRRPDVLAVSASIILLNNQALPDPWMQALHDAQSEGVTIVGALLPYAAALRSGDWGDVLGLPKMSDIPLREESGNKDLLQMLEENLCFWALSHVGTADEMAQWMTEKPLSGPPRNWHHLIYWRKQIEAGNGHRVWSEIQRGSKLEWLSADQLIEWGNLYQQSDQAAVLFTKVKPMLKMFPSSSDLHFYYATLLGHQQRWVELRTLALQIRSRPSLSDMEGLSYFFEAESWSGEQNPQAAAQSYLKWLAAPIRLPHLEWEAARKIRQAGLNDMALHRYRDLELYHVDDVLFWEEVLDLGRELQLERYQLDACKRLYDLSPDSREYAHQYASLLLAMRWDPALAIDLTGSLIQRFPEDQDIATTHTHALLQNNRLKEAISVLSSIQPDQMPDRIKEAYRLAQFERLYQEFRMEDACSFAEIIRPENLYIHQQIWLEEQLQKMKCR